MTYEEAQEESLKVEWKVSNCTEGEKCWCRIIEPKKSIIYNDIEEYYIVGSGCIPQKEAEHLVELHNKNLK